MINYTLREAFKSDDTIESSHLILAEWNMNKYQEIEHYGIYGLSTALEIFSINDASASIRSGKNYLLYNDEPLDSTEPDSNKYFSRLASVFEPNRPDPGIVLLQKYNRALITTDSRKIRISQLNGNSGNPRYYPFSETRKYDYFNSAKELSPKSNDNSVSGISDALTNIKGVNPYVTYTEEFPINKIVIKVQNHASWPDNFSVDILDSSSSVDRWIPVYQSTSSADFSTGELNLYYTGDKNSITFSKTVKYVDDIANVASVSNVDTVIVKGIRFNVNSMTRLPKRKFSVDGISMFPRTSLELIEISPRLEIDITNITETFSINSDMAQSNFGLPVGGLVTSNGKIDISNSDSTFMFNERLNELKLLSPDVLFKFYQRVTYSNTEYVIPIKEMYAVAWNIQNDFSVSIDLEDRFKILKQIKVPDLVFWTERGIPFSVIILTLLDNCGVTGLEFKKRTNNNSSDIEDTKIINFYCKKDETLLEVLEKLAISTQSAMYIDAVGKLNVLTKERVTSNVPRVDSTFSSVGTDFWLVGSPSTSSDPEHTFISDYIANISSIQEAKVNPITDGTITYHNFDIAKSPGGELLRDFGELELKSAPPAILALTDYVYKNSMLWEPKGSDAVLAAGNLNQNITASGPFSYMSASVIEAIDADDALRKLYRRASGSAASSMVIVVDSEELPLFTEYDNYVYVDSECIKYRGILYRTFESGSASKRIFFSREEYDSYVSNIQKGKSLIPIALMVDVNFKVTSKTSLENYNFKIISDGRGSEGTKMQTHYAYTEDDPMLSASYKYSITLGKTKKVSKKNNALLQITNKFDYIDISPSLKKYFKNTMEYSKVFAGLLKIEGPKALASDLATTSASSDTGVINNLTKLNEQVDKTVQGGSTNFDPYVLFHGDKNIYAQRIDLSKSGFLGTNGFSKNVNYVSTTMRLISPAKFEGDSFRQETLSSMGGIGININPDDKTGYYLEVQANGDYYHDEAALLNNLRFYKVTYDSEGDGYKPKILLTAQVAAIGQIYEGQIEVSDTSSDTRIEDPVFTISITIKKINNNKDVEFGIYYGTELIGTHTEKIENGFDDSNFNQMCLFVRNDSQAVYEDFLAAQIPINGNPDNYFAKSPEDVRSIVRRNSVSQDFIFDKNPNSNEDLKVFYNDFSRLVREAKMYDIRFDKISLLSRLIDVSKINSKFQVVKYTSTPFGAKFFVKNTAGNVIRFSDKTLTPLYITGIALEELGTGNIKMSDTFKDDELKNIRSDPLSKNTARYGVNEFSIDSLFIQRREQAKKLSDWILKNCCYERRVLQCEIFANPILELGDKVRVFDKARGYYLDNPSYEDTVYVISTISYEGSPNGVSMSIKAIEVGQK